jgi:ribonuclease BN (tRNA processing enzyme)
MPDNKGRHVRTSNRARPEVRVGRVICLGTGDPLNAERAQTSLAVRLPGEETVLFDASSGTILLGQLRAASISIEEVRHLFVSHRHFDHAGGLAPLLITMASLPAAALTIYALPGTSQALRELLALTIPGVEDWLGSRLGWRELTPEEPILLGYTEMTPFLVDHSVESVGYRVVQNSSVLVFSGDTRPCRTVVEHSRGADLLIHETYGTKDESEWAHTVGHSTASDAGEVARDAGVDRLVLTHFRESRFANPRELAAEAASAFGGPVEAARDLDTFEF